jgi:16S rRNA (guanine527-N7)-methyltransferase
MSSALWRIETWFPELSADQLKCLQIFHEDLIKFNKKLDLIPTKSEDNADEIHFADCIYAAQLAQETLSRDVVYDIGSGSGMPGLVICCLNPKQKIKLVEKDSRKAEFLKFMVKKMEFKNAEVLVSRIEELPANSIRIGICRSFQPIGKSLLVCRKQFAVSSEFLHIKGPEWSTEIVDTPSQIIGIWDPKLYASYQLPLLNSERYIVSTIKKR